MIHSTENVAVRESPKFCHEDEEDHKETPAPLSVSVKHSGKRKDEAPGETQNKGAGGAPNATEQQHCD